MMERTYYVYVLASRRNGTLYVGMTSDLVKRVWEHKSKQVEGFTKQHRVDRLVYYEAYDDACDATTRERQMKKWRREWKVALVEKENPGWLDLYEEITA